MSAARRLPDPPALPGFTRTSGELGGGGANGLVFRARCDATQEPVAIKYLYRGDLAARADGVAVLERELRNHALSVHPHIAGFRQAVLLPEWVAIVCELCEGQNLLGWLNMQPQRQASEAVARGIMVQILSALHHMHGTGIVHRDIKARAFALQARLCAERLPRRPTTSAWRARLLREKCPCSRWWTLEHPSRCRWTPSPTRSSEHSFT